MIFKKIIHLFNPDEWMVKLLKLSVIKEKSSLSGVVIIQIDGLSHMEFRRALQKKEMPCLAKLLKDESYQERIHYSGLPASTPAVQGTLFYGVKCCVPAFSYKDKETGKIFNMFSPGNAIKVENRIKKQGKPLLKKGSAYGNIYTGGAKEAHFCISAIGWGTLLSAADPIAIVVFILMHLHIIIRSVILTVMESFLAVLDSIRGFIKGKNLLDEILYIPFRIVECIIAREVTATGAKIDIIRGIPVIHVNLAGYDEQSHHRGPGSKFAHWSLRGIDKVIGSMLKAVQFSKHRHYDVFVYSDHGQEEAIYYKKENGISVQTAVNEVLKKTIGHDNLHMEKIRKGYYWNTNFSHNQFSKKIIPQTKEFVNKNPLAVITALGSIGFIYLPQKLAIKQTMKIALQLVNSAKIPLVLVRNGRGQAIAWNTEGKFYLPRDASRILGGDHPFLRETAKDLVKLCHHNDAGEIVISGFKKEGKTVTFYPERGSHAGPGVNETAGFALLPPDTQLSREKTIYTGEIRKAIFHAIDHDVDLNRGKSTNTSNLSKLITLKILSYNVHSCRGLDGKMMPDRIARVIGSHNPDIIALQEIDADDTVHQAKAIAKMLALNFHYHSSVVLKTGQHGNAIFSKFDLRLVKSGSLPSLIDTPFLEKRGALWVEADVAGCKVQIINTHLSLFPPEGRLQIKHLLGGEWLGSPVCKDPVIFCGDFNSLPHSKICKAVEEKMHSIHFDVADHACTKTFPSFLPLGRVDHLFLGEGVIAQKIEIPKTLLEKTASDHLPLIAVVSIKNREKT